MSKSKEFTIKDLIKLFENKKVSMAFVIYFMLLTSVFLFIYVFIRVNFK